MNFYYTLLLEACKPYRIRVDARDEPTSNGTNYKIELINAEGTRLIREVNNLGREAAAEELVMYLLRFGALRFEKAMQVELPEFWQLKLRK